MTKSELLLRLAKKHPHMYQRDIETLVDTILDNMSQMLIDGGRIEIRGFGAFSIRKRNARKARNPKSGQEVQVADRYAIYFRMGKELKERINKPPVTTP